MRLFLSSTTNTPIAWPRKVVVSKVALAIQKKMIAAAQKKGMGRQKPRLAADQKFPCPYENLHAHCFDSLYRQLVQKPHGRRHSAESCGRFHGGSQRGSKPAGYVHPLAIKVLAEIGIDISGHTSRHMSEFLTQPVTTVITVCGNADQACPIFPGQVNRYHWGFDDPAHAVGTDEEILAVFRRVRDEIKRVFEPYALGYRDALKAGG